MKTFSLHVKNWFIFQSIFKIKPDLTPDEGGKSKTKQNNSVLNREWKPTKSKMLNTWGLMRCLLKPLKGCTLCRGVVLCVPRVPGCAGDPSPGQTRLPRGGRGSSSPSRIVSTLTGLQRWEQGHNQASAGESLLSVTICCSNLKRAGRRHLPSCHAQGNKPALCSFRMQFRVPRVWYKRGHRGREWAALLVSKHKPDVCVVAGLRLCFSLLWLSLLCFCKRGRSWEPRCHVSKWIQPGGRQHFQASVQIIMFVQRAFLETT